MRKLVLGVVLLLVSWGGLSQRAATSSRVASVARQSCMPGSIVFCQELSGLVKQVPGSSSAYRVANEGTVPAIYAHSFYTLDEQLTTNLPFTLMSGETMTSTLATQDHLPNGWEGYVVILSDQPFVAEVVSPTVIVEPTPTATLVVPTNTSVYLPLVIKAPPPPTPTPTPIPTATPTLVPPTATPVSVAPNCSLPAGPGAPETPVRIVTVNKSSEVVTISNVSTQPVTLDGWWICSLTGHQLHAVLAGSIAPGQSLVIASQAGALIWNNSVSDPGALFSSSGQQISYWPD